MNKNIEVAIRVLERLKGESLAFQEDALWKIGDFLSNAVDHQIFLEEEALFQELREFHLEITEMMHDELCEECQDCGYGGKAKAN